MKKLLFLLFVPSALAQNLGLDSAGNLFPQTDATKWLGSESNRFYMLGTREAIIRGGDNPLSIKNEGVGQQGGIKYWSDQAAPVWTVGPRAGDSNRFYISGLLGMGGGNDVALISTNMIPAISTRGYVYHNGSLSITGVFNIPIAGTKQILSAGSTINVTNNSAVQIESTGGPIKLTAPNISAGREGDLVWITGDSITNTVELVDESIQGGSRIRFATGTNRIVALYKWFGFRYVDSHNVWELISESAPTAAAAGGSGDVTAASSFASDAKVILSDGAGTKGVKSSVINVDALGNITGVNTIIATGVVTTANGPTVTNAFGNDERVLRSDGTVRGVQGSAVGLADNGAFTFPTGITQVFAPSSINAGINVGTYNGIPSSISNGGIWYYTGKNCLYAFYAASSSQYAISPRDELNLDLRNFKASGGPAPVFDQSEDADKWTFVDDTTSIIQTQFPIGHSWGSTASVYLMFSSATTNAGNVVFALQSMQSFAGGTEAVNGSGYVAAVNLTAAPVATFLGGLAAASGSMPMDGVTGPGNSVLFKFRIQRRGADASDTAVGDIKLHAVKVDWVRNN